MAILFIFQTICFSLLFYFRLCQKDLKELKLNNILSDSSNYDNYYSLKIESNNNDQDLVFDLYGTDVERNDNPDIYISTVIYFILIISHYNIF